MSCASETLRVAIVTSECGGTLVAAKAIERAVQRRFPSSIPSLILIDDLWPGSGVNSYQWYLLLAREGYYRLIHWLTSLEKRLLPFFEAPFLNGLSQKIKRESHQPHILISTVPFINVSLFKIAEELRIPLFVVTTDMDCRLYGVQWPKSEELPPHRLGVVARCPEVISRIPLEIDRSKLVFTGGFLKNEFERGWTEEEKHILRKEISFIPGREVVSLMMGSLGGRQIQEYVKRIILGEKLREWQKSAHFLIFCGKNGRLKTGLEQLVEREGFKKREKGVYESKLGKIAFTFFDYLEAIAPYYALSCGLITKPGSGSIHEALSMNLPLMIDKLNGHLPWEGLAAEIVEIYGLGSVLTDIERLPQLINEQFFDPFAREATCKRQLEFKALYNDPHSFSCRVGETIEQLLVESRIRHTSVLEKKNSRPSPRP